MHRVYSLLLSRFYAFHFSLQRYEEQWEKPFLCGKETVVISITCPIFHGSIPVTMAQELALGSSIQRSLFNKTFWECDFFLWSWSLCRNNPTQKETTTHANSTPSLWLLSTAGPNPTLHLAVGARKRGVLMAWGGQSARGRKKVELLLQSSSYCCTMRQGYFLLLHGLIAHTRSKRRKIAKVLRIELVVVVVGGKGRQK